MSTFTGGWLTCAIRVWGEAEAETRRQTSLGKTEPPGRGRVKDGGDGDEGPGFRVSPHYLSRPQHGALKGPQCPQ